MPTTSTAPASHEPTRAVLVAMASSIAVLDAEGRMLQTNAASGRFAQATGASRPDAWVGAAAVGADPRRTPAELTGAGT